MLYYPNFFKFFKLLIHTTLEFFRRVIHINNNNCTKYYNMYNVIINNIKQ